uniref:YqaJ domain-containing protein n=1 Tax=Macrostomum lignano TaxID=282301 RepID=A0A1I8FG20_9PLAT
TPLLTADSDITAICTEENRLGFEAKARNGGWLNSKGDSARYRRVAKERLKQQKDPESLLPYPTSTAYQELYLSTPAMGHRLLAVEHQRATRYTMNT